MEYFYIDESGKKAGPIPEDAIRALYKAGVVTPATLVSIGETGEWKACGFRFGFVGGPLPPSLVKAPPRDRWEVLEPHPRQRSRWPLAFGAILAAAAAAGIAARFHLLPFPPSSTSFDSVLSSLIGKSAPTPNPFPSATPPPIHAEPQAQPTPAPGLQAAAKSATSPPIPDEKAAKAVVKTEEKTDALAEWYEVGFHQGIEAREIFSAFGRKLEPSKAQLAQLLINLDVSSESMTPDGMSACFDGYRDGCQGAPPSRSVPASQKRSALPFSLRLYHKFEGDDNNVAGASSDVLEHALACTVMIVALKGDRWSLGSGFFIGPGVLVTNRHVVQDVSQFSVRMPDRSVVLGQLIAMSKIMDVALLSIPTKDHPFLRIAASQTVRVGDRVTAVGFPASFSIAKFSGSNDLGPFLQQMEATSTFGYVSALNRRFEGNDCLQLDVTINHGNSGGPLIDAEGRVIGINTFGLSGEQVERTNFAIKMSAAMPFIQKHCGFTVDVEE